jgi:hypothetical protein
MDKLRHDTIERGERRYNAALTDRQAWEIRAEYATGNYSAVALAARFRVPANVVRMLVSGRRYRHVPGALPETLLREIARKNHAAGERSGNATLTDGQVAEMRRLYATGLYRREELARRYRVNVKTFVKAASGATWAHVPGALSREELARIGRSHRIRVGTEHGSAKLTEGQVREIRRLWAEGSVSKAELGRRFGVSGCTAGMIVNRQVWRHIA